MGKKYPRTEEWQRKMSESRKGYKHSEETRLKLSRSHIDKLGIKASNFKDGRSSVRVNVLIRDNYTCQICGLHDEEIMEVDHIRPQALAPELKYMIDNMVTLCPNCHRRKTNRELRSRIFPRKSS